MGRSMARITGMKLLIVTQAMDIQDPVLGFFVRWVEEFAKYAERIEVICLKEGKHSLPANVRVHSLGKERRVSRVKYVFNFYRYLWRLRRNYDAVFVHMNPEYVVLGGVWWRLWGKKIALWYTHKHVDLKLRLAALLANIVFTASEESFRLQSKKVHIVGHGIDVDFFTPDAGVARGDWMLSVGRLMSSKRHDVAIEAAAQAHRELRVIGEGPERERLISLATALGANVRFLGGLTQAQLRGEYRTAGVLVHTSETGSLDKVVLEALACGLPVITTSTALAGLPVTVVPAMPDAIAKGVPAVRQTAGAQALVAYVREHHSLRLLIPNILRELAS